MPIRMPRLTVMLLSGVFALSGGVVVAQTPAGSPPPAASSGAQSKELTQAQIEQLLAPVALYPDALLAQILMASTYPLEVVEAARWRKANPNLKEKALDDALMQQPWDESVKSLTTFPPVLEMMNEKLSWTQQLGDAFLADQQRVMSAVQKLRKAANDTGNLKSTKEQVVIVEQAASQTVIKIEPADPQVVYVPSYNPTVVYGTWPYPAYPPYPYYPPGYAPGAAFWTFTAGVVVGAALWGNCNWGRGEVEINNSFNRSTSVTGGDRTNVAGGGRAETRPSGGQGGQGGQKWNHNPDHRRGVSYKDQGVAQKYDRGGASARDAKSREQFRGNTGAGYSDRGQGAGRGGSDGGGRGGASAGTREASGGRQGSGFGGADQGRQASDFGSRGQSSRASAGGGSRGGGGASASSRSGGGASSASRGGGGGGGRSSGGGRGGRR